MTSLLTIVHVLRKTGGTACLSSHPDVLFLTLSSRGSFSALQIRHVEWGKACQEGCTNRDWWALRLLTDIAREMGPSLPLWQMAGESRTGAREIEVKFEKTDPIKARCLIQTSLLLI